MELFKQIHLEKRYSSNFQSCNSALVGFCVILCCFFYKIRYYSFPILVNNYNFEYSVHKTHLCCKVDDICIFLSYLKKTTEAVALDFVKKRFNKQMN